MLFNSFSVIELHAERAIHRRARRIGAQMIRAHGAVYIVKDIVHTDFYAVRQHPVLPTQVVRGIDTPYLERLAVAVVLIVALTAAATRQTDTQGIAGTERMAVHGRRIPFMVCRTIYRHRVHAVLLLVIQVCLGVQIAVCRIQRQSRHHLVRQRHIHATGPRIIHILIHARLHICTAVAQIGRGDTRWNLARRHVHQRYHIVQFVHITCDRCRHPAAAILHIGRPVVADLRIQVGIADVKERTAAHHVQVTVVQFLYGRRLEALAPPHAETEIARRQHGTHLRTQMQSEAAVVHQSQSCRHIQPVQHVTLVLHIHGSRLVAGGTRRGTVGGVQVVVTVFGTGRQRILVGQIEDTLQLCHQPLLVTLQLALSGQHRHREPFSVQITVFLALQEHIVVVLGRIVVIVRVLVPVHVKRNDVLTPQLLYLLTPQLLKGLPFSPNRRRRIIIPQVVGIYVAAGVRTVPRAHDVLLIVRALGIQFQILHRLPRHPLGNLPVSELVHRHVLTVRQHRRLGILFRSILPAVATLQLEIGLGTELAKPQRHAVMLTQVVVRAIARDIVGIHTHYSPLARWRGVEGEAFLRDDIDDTGHRVTSIQRTLSTLHNLNLLDVVRVNQTQVVLTAHVTVNALAVNEYQDIRVTQAVQLHLAAHIAFVEGKRSCQSGKDVLQTLAAILLQHLLRNHLRLHRGILQQVLRARTGHHHLLQRVRAPHVALRLDRQHHANHQHGNCQQSLH